MKLTKWFDGDTTPDLAGVYERKFQWNKPDKGQYAYWDGRKWGSFVGSYDSPNDAYKERKSISAYQEGIQWRGLAEKP